MGLSLNSIPFMEFLDGTIQIAIFYIILTIIIVILLLVKFVDKLIQKLNTKIVTKDSSKFKVVYIFLSIAIAFTLSTIIYISIRDYQTESDFMFFVFASLSFFFLPLSLGIISVTTYSLNQEKIQWGNILLLLLFFSIIAYLGANIHDLIWCYKETNGLQVESLGGKDMAPFFRIFGISDTSQWDYRTFFFYITVQVFVELITAILMLVKFIKINKQNRNFNALASIFIFLLVFINSIILGIFVFIFDYPFTYTCLAIRLTVFLGIPFVASIFALSGFLMSKYVTPKITIPIEMTNEQ